MIRADSKRKLTVQATYTCLPQIVDEEAEETTKFPMSEKEKRASQKHHYGKKPSTSSDLERGGQDQRLANQAKVKPAEKLL